MCLKGLCKNNYNLSIINTLTTIYCQNSYIDHNDALRRDLCICWSDVINFVSAKLWSYTWMLKDKDLFGFDFNKDCIFLVLVVKNNFPFFMDFHRFYLVEFPFFLQIIKIWTFSCKIYETNSIRSFGYFSI